MRRVTGALQRAAAASGQPPVLVGADQEGGTLLALPGATRFPGNLALGATRSVELARRTGFAIGRELAAMGIKRQLCAGVRCAEQPEQPGDRATLVRWRSGVGRTACGCDGSGAAASWRGGHGQALSGAWGHHHRLHYGTPVLPFDLERLRKVELVPFAAAVKAGARLVMTAHIALPAITGGLEMPATLSPAILRGLLRGELGFEGVIVSDAMNMRAIEQGPGLAIDSIAAVAAGVDLLMFVEKQEALDTIFSGLVQAARRGLLAQETVYASAGRVIELKAWLAEQEQPDLSVVNCAEHQALAYEVAAKACTLVRDEARVLPLRLADDARVLAIVPQPADLTPADTSSYDLPPLGEALRKHHGTVDEVVMPLNPTMDDVAALRETASGYDLVVVGTINATDYKGQGSLVNGLVESGAQVVAAALRLPLDITAYPSVPTYVCTYSIQPASMEALGDALWGRVPFAGKLPVAVAGFEGA